MSQVKFDFAEFKASDKGVAKFEMPPADVEAVCIVRKDGTEERVSKTSGNKYQQVKLEIISDPGRGYYLYYSIPGGEFQMSFLGRLLEALGFDLRKVKAVDYNKLVGKRCRAKIKHELRGGVTRAVINYFMPYNKQIEAIEAKEAASIDDTTAKPDEEGTSDENMPF